MRPPSSSPARVSVHGGHSGQFCSHAEDTLEDVIRAYIAKGFAWAGITEHMPPATDALVLPEEAAAGMSARDNYERFAGYIAASRRLQRQYADEITLYVGFETEAFTGYEPFLRRLLDAFKPDYIVGSVHHVNDILIDATPERYRQAIETAGGIDALYQAYFDKQYELITTFRPAVVGHFDLIRLFDPDYPQRLQRPGIWKRILRNLEAIKAADLIMDFNLKALAKGQSEPYISRPILRQAHEMGIAVVPGDDAHGVRGVGRGWEKGVRILEDIGFDTRWRTPV